MTWSPQQESAIKAVQSWLKQKNGPQVFYLAGFAGTGKTTLAKDLASEVKGKVLFGAFTGKAALVLQRKGCHGASTIHSLIYSVEDGENAEPTFRLNPASPVASAKLVVIDECSMVGEDLGRDLLSFKTKVLVLGDPAQLPPVKGAGFFTSRQPDAMLTEVHRQARDNPIIALSMRIRDGERLRLGTYGESRVITRDDVEASDILSADQVLVGMNKTRRSYNDRIRSLKGLDAEGPVPTDKLVALRNNREKKILNGGLWAVVDVLDREPDQIHMMAISEDRPDDRATEIRVPPQFFCGREDEIPPDQLRWVDQFDYGYVLSVHKSQGSQWRDVVIFDESHVFREDRAKHLYTAVTRASDRVTVVLP